MSPKEPVPTFWHHAATSRIALVLLAVVTVASAAPLVSVLLSSMAAGLLDCRLDEGAAHACRLAGGRHRRDALCGVRDGVADALDGAGDAGRGPVLGRHRCAGVAPPACPPKRNRLRRHSTASSLGASVQRDPRHEKRQQQGQNGDDEDAPEGDVKGLLQHRPHAGRRSGKGVRGDPATAAAGPN